MLIEASLEGNFEVAKYLVEMGADVNYVGPLGWTALMYACVNRHFNIIKLLVEKGADVNAQHQDGFTPIMMSMLNAETQEIQNYLIAHGADLQYAGNWLRARGII